MPEESPSARAKLPEWAPRLSQAKLRRFYQNDARRIYDPDLIDEVGYTLRARCQSFLQAVRAVRGEVICPVCEQTVHHQAQKDETLVCSQCGWQLPWAVYFSTIQHKQLSGAEPVLELFQRYCEAFPHAQSLPEKVFLIDRLIHEFHWNLFSNELTPTRPVAVNLIEGRLRDVIAFLDDLSFGEDFSPGVQQNRLDWEENMRKTRGWMKAPPEPPLEQNRAQSEEE
jgi:ribosomal protein L37AE/L43A